LPDTHSTGAVYAVAVDYGDAGGIGGEEVGAAMSDERRAFEAWGKKEYRESWGMAPKDGMWAAWQARAALTRGKATGSTPPPPELHGKDEIKGSAAPAPVEVAMDAEHWAELYRLREEVKGPDGFATWKDAAIAERLRTTGAIEALRRSLDDLYAQSYGLRGNFHEGYCKAIDDVRAALAPPSP
jgi:hypothetical protein